MFNCNAMTTRKPIKRQALEANSDFTRDNVNGNDFQPPVAKKARSDYPRVSSCEPAPLTSQLPPPSRREKQVTYEEAIQGTVEPVRVYADGVFDMFHSGHARALMQAKIMFPNTHLIVGVTCDELTHRLKGNTVCNEQERYDALRHCRYVDEVLDNAPWTVTPEFLDDHQIDFVAHDDLPYNCGNSEDVYKQVKEMGKFVAIQRTPGVSTSDLIARVVRDYDTYIRRNFARGYTAKDLNVGFMKEKEVRIRAKVNNLRAKVGGKLGEWEGKSKDMMAGFVGLFGWDGRISEFFHGQKEKMKRAFSPLASPDRTLGENYSDDDSSADETLENYYTPNSDNGQGSISH